MKKALVYCLMDPRYMQPRYIGGTVRTLEKRLKGHIAQARCTNSKNFPSQIWIRSLISDGIYPIIKLIWVCEGENYHDEEIFWIAFYRMHKCDLTNVSDGGGWCPTNRVISELTRQRLSKPKSEKHKKNIGLAHKGKKKSPESVEKQRQKMIGKKHSEEQNRNHSITMMGNTHTKGYKHTNESKINMAKGREGLLGPNTGRNLSEEHKKALSISVTKSKKLKKERETNENLCNEKLYYEIE